MFMKKKSMVLHKNTIVDMATVWRENIWQLAVQISGHRCRNVLVINLSYKGNSPLFYGNKSLFTSSFASEKLSNGLVKHIMPSGKWNI